MSYSLIITTCENTDDAKAIADALLREQLAACVQIQNIESFYIWEGKTQNANEVMLLIKTKSNLYKEVEMTILKSHKYRVPEIIEIPVNKGLPAYFKWIDEVTK
jgi:periplasmic divalent cation tolerance protein